MGLASFNRQRREERSKKAALTPKKQDLKSLNKNDLVDLAKKNKISNIKGLNKNELIEVIENARISKTKA